MQRSEKDIEQQLVEKEIPKSELEDRDWYKIYAAVLVTTVIVISALWAFSRYFSN